MRGEPSERKHSMQGSLAVGGASGSRLFEGGPRGQCCWSGEQQRARSEVRAAPLSVFHAIV